MYLLWQYKNMSPHEFYNLKKGEKIILSAFMEHFLEEEINKQNEIAKAFD